MLPSFDTLPLAAPLQRALRERGYHTPTPIQAQAIPPLLAGRDLLGGAQTGTGKTAAFSLPILDALHRDGKRARAGTARVLVLTPTRELATQVGRSFADYGTHLDIRQALVFGGVGQRPQEQAMRHGVEVLVACPGRLMDLVQQGIIDLSAVEYFVIDEVDRMLDMGFIREVRKIIAKLPRRRQSLFFSATLAPPIVKLAGEILVDPVHISIEPEVTTTERVDQQLYFVAREHKRSLLLERLATQRSGDLSIVFSRTKHGANKLARQISTAGFEAEAIHGNRSQAQRDRTLDKFRAGRLPVLVATDVAARGVDVKAVTLVVNFDLPNEAEAYVHRIGRTGRAGASGHAISFCAPEELEQLRDIERLIRQDIPVEAAHSWHRADMAKLDHRPAPKPASKTRANRSRRRSSRRRSA